MADSIIGKISVGDGATFTPSVNNSGVISWTNNKNLENPASVDLPAAVIDRYLLAPIASPAFTGTPTAPTQAKTDNSTKLATTAYVKAIVADYLALTGGSITGDVDITGDLSVSGTISGNLTGNVTGDVTGNVTGTASENLPLSGGTMTGTITTTGYPAIKSPTNADQITIAGGSGTGSADGAKFILNGGTRSSNAGEFTVQAGNGNGYKQLVGKPSGEFTWGGSNVAVMGTLQNGHGILTGHVTGISLNANSYYNARVNFGQTFAAKPIVVVCTASGHAHVSAGTNQGSVSTSDFSYIVSNETSSAFTNESITWIAIG